MVLKDKSNLFYFGVMAEWFMRNPHKIDHSGSNPLSTTSLSPAQWIWQRVFETCPDSSSLSWGSICNFKNCAV